MKIHCFSSFTFSYLNRARVLFESVRRYHPDWTLTALITDRPPPGFEFSANEPWDHTVYATDMWPANDPAWLFKHDVVEVCTAVKGPFLHAACTAGSHDAAIYLDPDTCLFSPLSELIELLPKHDIILTPHLLHAETEDAGVRDNEISALRAGIYNLGFVAIRTSGEGARFAKWWSDRLSSYCFDNIPLGLFVDQRWCDHVPALFENVLILRHPGYNVASWNVGKRKLKFSAAGELMVNGEALRFWHFTKLGPIGDAMTKRYAGRNFPVYEIWAWYRDQVRRCTDERIPGKWWYFGAYSDGVAITKGARVLYRDRGDLQKAFADPYDALTLLPWLRGNGHEDLAG